MANYMKKLSKEKILEYQIQMKNFAFSRGFNNVEIMQVYDEIIHDTSNLPVSNIDWGMIMELKETGIFN